MKSQIIARSVSLCAALLCSNLCTAQNILKSDTTTMSAAADWSGTAPTASTVGEIGATPQAATLAGMTLGGAVSLAGLQLDNTMNGPLAIASGNTLTLGTSGINMSAANQNATLGCALTLGGAESWNVGSPQTLTVNGAVAINNLLTINGTGTVAFGTTANTGTGGLTISSGNVTFGAAASAGTGTLTLGGGTLAINGLTVANAIAVTGNALLTNGLTASTFSGNFTGAGTLNVIEGTNATITFSAAGGLSAFTGTLKVSDAQPIGFIRFSGTASGSSAATFDLGNSSIIVHTRNGQSVSLGALKGGANSVVMGARSTTGATTPYTIGANNLSTVFSGMITNGTVAGATVTLTKVGTGTLTLAGPNAYTGSTTNNAGTLQIGNGTASGTLGIGAVIIASGATLAFDRPDNYTNTDNIANSGTLAVFGGGTNTYNTGTYTGTGAVNVTNGGFVLASPAAALGPVYVGSGGTLDLSQDTSFASVQSLSGSGTLNLAGPSTVVTVTGNVSAGGNGTAGTLAVNGSLTKNGGVNNSFVLSNVGGTNDLLTVSGNLTVSGMNTITLTEFGGGLIPGGIYPLIAYSGTLTGGINNFQVVAFGNATLTNITSVTPNEIAVVVAAAARPALNLTWVGDGVLNYWDLASTNWVNGGTNYVFQTGDSVVFNDSTNTNPNVNIQVAVDPASLVVDSATQQYIFTGAGGIGGPVGLTKTNGGTLTLLNNNSYTGPTIIGGGVLELETGALLSSGSASPIGAASGSPANLVFYGSTLKYSGTEVSNGMDHGMTIVNGMTVNVTNAGTAFTEYGLVTGSGGLTKVGNGTFVLQNAAINTYTGGTVISNGVLALGNNTANWDGAAGSGVGSTNSPITFMGTVSTLQLYGWLGYSNYLINFNDFYNPLVVPAGQVGTLELPGRGNPSTGAGSGLDSSLSGSGTLNLVANYVRYSMSGNWSAFSGLINVTGAGFPNANANTVGAVTANVDEFRINNSFGYTNAAIYLAGDPNGDFNSPPSTLVMCQTVGSGATINIGELGGDITAIIGTGTGSSGSTTWSVGWKNTTNTFYGTIANDAQSGVGVTSITKVGTGKWILAGQNTYSGTTSISNGVLALIRNPLSGNDGSIANSTNVFINTGAVLDISGVSAPTLIRNTGQGLGGGGTLNGSVNASGAALTPGSTSATGTLTITGGLTESGVTNKFQLSTNANPDVINVQGTLDVSSGPQIISLNEFGGGPMPNGIYPLFTYNAGSLVGGTNNFSVVGGPGSYPFAGLLTNITTVTPNEIAFVVTSGRSATNLVWAGDSVSNNWDYVTTNDWINGAKYFGFLPGDSVTFNDNGAPNTNVTLQTALSPASVVVSNSALENYTFSGSGNISGSSGLLKTNSGTLILQTANTYTGQTIIGGGTISVSSVTNGGLASPLGAASNNATNLLFYDGGTLKYTGPSAGTDRGATLNGSGGIYDVVNGTILTNSGVITGSGGLTLTDTGTLTLSAANSFTGNIVINGGKLSDINVQNVNYPVVGGLGNPQIPGRTVTINNSGILSLDASGGNEFGGGSVTNLLGYIINQGGVMQITSGNATIGPVTLNGGTMNVLSGANTGAQYGAYEFTGDVTVGGTTPSTIQSTIAASYCLTAGTLVPYRTFNVTNTNAVLNVTAVLGDSGGTQASAGLVKAGAGTMTMSAANIYTGATTVSNGTLLVGGTIGNGVVTVAGGTLLVRGSIGNGGVTVANGTLGGSGTIGGAVNVQSGGIVAPGAGTNVAGTVLTINNSLALNSGSATTMAVSHNNQTNDQIVCQAVVYGGTLTVTTNAGDAPLVAGNAFRLFNVSLNIYSGSFSATNLPALSPGLVWSNSLASNGSITVAPSLSSGAPVTISGGAITGGMFVISGTNGVPGAQYRILETTNAALAITNWTPVWTNVFGAGGSFSYTNTPGANPAGFFLLVSP